MLFHLYAPTTFQSTLPCGSDLIVTVQGDTKTISIHAPLRERLIIILLIPKYADISIHAPLRERHMVFLLLISWLLFQSTLPCGSDLLNFIKRPKSTNFNPRSLAGATFSYLWSLPWLYISIHAPLRERLFHADHDKQQN